MPAIVPARAQTTRAYRRRLGEYEITALSDGFVDLSYNVWQNIDIAALDRAVDAAFLVRGGVRNGITSHLINTGRRLILVDSGAANLFGPNSHHFPGNLADAGLSPEVIDDVFVTHAHPDHVGALLRDGKPVLPRARLHMSRTEYDFWTSLDAQAKAPDYMRSWFDLVRGLVAAYDGRITTFAAEANMGDGITALPFPGHTPGHTAYLIESEGERLMIWGDLAVSTAIQFPNPRASMIFDIDADTGHASRLRGFDLAATDRLLVAGTHLTYPTFGYVARRDGAFAWVAEEWRHDLARTPFVPVV